MQLREFLKISRPRFWIYTLGPYLVGVAAGIKSTDDFLSFKNILFLVYFALPANLLIYGVNDIFDRETDAKNPKKLSHEKLLKTQEISPLSLVLLGAGFLSLVLFFLLPNPASQWWLFGFLLLSIGYSAPPLRFKARAFLDAYSNLLYACAGFVGYAVFAGAHPSLVMLLASLTFAAALHTFSAIPDIADDARAGIQTTAVQLGRTRALWFVGMNWLASAVLFASVLGWVAAPLFSYPVLVAWLATQPPETLERVYWKIPYINGVIGFCGFWYLILSRFGYQEVMAAFLRVLN